MRIKQGLQTDCTAYSQNRAFFGKLASVKPNVSMVILYADDDLEDLDTFCDIAKQINPTIEVINARNGSEVLEYLENSPDLPGMIFLDINMPTMDGKSCLKFIKKDERFNTIPVIIYTTSNNQRDLQLCKELGASGFIKKPSSMKEATEKLASYFA